MSNKKILSNESVWSTVKSNLRNPDMPEVFNSKSGERLVYFPAGSIYTGPGYKNVNCKEFTFISPEGAKVTVTNLRAFCKDIFGLTETGRPKYVSSFSELASGKRTLDNVQGWTLYKEEDELIAA